MTLTLAHARCFELRCEWSDFEALVTISRDNDGRWLASRTRDGHAVWWLTDDGSWYSPMLPYKRFDTPEEALAAVLADGAMILDGGS